jgi:hypothetical protein
LSGVTDENRESVRLADVRADIWAVRLVIR